VKAQRLAARPRTPTCSTASSVSKVMNPEAPGALRLMIVHHDDVGDVPKLLKVLAEVLLSDGGGEAPYEDLLRPARAPAATAAASLHPHRRGTPVHATSLALLVPRDSLLGLDLQRSPAAGQDDFRASALRCWPAGFSFSGPSSLNSLVSGICRYTRQHQEASTSFLYTQGAWERRQRKMETYLSAVNGVLLLDDAISDVRVGGHDEPEAPGAARLLVLHDDGLLDLAVRLEVVAGGAPPSSPMRCRR